MASLKKMCDVFVVVFCWNQVRVRLILDPPNVASACPHFSVFLFLGVAGKKKKIRLCGALIMKRWARKVKSRLENCWGITRASAPTSWWCEMAVRTSHLEQASALYSGGLTPVHIWP